MSKTDDVVFVVPNPERVSTRINCGPDEFVELYGPFLVWCKAGQEPVLIDRGELRAQEAVEFERCLDGVDFALSDILRYHGLSHGRHPDSQS